MICAFDCDDWTHYHRDYFCVLQCALDGRVRSGGCKNKLPLLLLLLLLIKGGAPFRLKIEGEFLLERRSSTSTNHVFSLNRQDTCMSKSFHTPTPSSVLLAVFIFDSKSQLLDRFCP